MKSKTYIWSWKDDETVHVNQDNSLEAIIENIIGYYTDEQAEDISIEKDGDQFAISFYDTNQDENRDYKISATPWDVAEFLTKLAEEYEREDWFEIKELEQ